ncbi:MAG: glycosyltransferase family 1 protein [Myxococcales bacterium]|nr:glycosyltransferase family 1 protein [Myxococcales bacterium]
MKILLSPIGSRGDVQPMVALGLGLRARGHTVDFLAAETFDALLSERYGFRCLPGTPDIQEMLTTHAADLSSPIATARLLSREVKSQLQGQIDALCGVVRAYDLVVGAGVHMAGASVCEAKGVPYRSALYVPQLLPSGAHPPFLVPYQGLPAGLNRWMHGISNRLIDRWMLQPLRGYRRSAGLPDVADAMTMVLGKAPLLCCASELAGIPDDTRLEVQQTGALVLPLPADTALDANLLQFIEAGTPPVYVGFGSMVDPTPERTADLVREAAAIAGVRIVLGTGWSDSHAQVGEQVMVIRAAPHALLLPRCLAAVHHGGAGTTFAAAMAGVPQLLVPHLMDQYYWGARITERGLGPTAIPRKKLTAKKLARALVQCRDGPGMRERAAHAGAALSKTDGVATAIAVLEQVVMKERG